MTLRSLGQSDLRCTPIGIGTWAIGGGTFLRNPGVTGAIVGVRSTQQVSGIAGAADLDLSANDLLDIERTLVGQAA